MANVTSPPSMRTSLTKPKETMSRLRPGNLTCLSASKTCSCVAICPLSLELLEDFPNDGDGLVAGAYHPYVIHIARSDETALDHRLPHPVDEAVPHVPHQDQGMLLDVLHLDEL